MQIGASCALEDGGKVVHVPSCAACRKAALSLQHMGYSYYLVQCAKTGNGLGCSAIKSMDGVGVPTQYAVCSETSKSLMAAASQAGPI